MTALQEPLPAALAGNTAARAVKRYWLATRPPFLSASAAPVVVGSAWGFSSSGSLDWTRATLALVATVLVHASANVLNDVADDESGTDPINTDRIYPYTGGSRFIQNGVLTRLQMQRFGIALLTVSVLIGLALSVLAGPVVLALGLVGAALGTLYSLKPARLAARGLGEISIAAAFGILPFCGAAWLQGAQIDALALLLSLPIAMWVTAILLINEVPDIAADRQADKRTLPVRFGMAWTRHLYVGLHLVAVTATVAAVAMRGLHIVTLMASAGLFVSAISASRAIQSPVDRSRLKASIETTLKLHVLGSLVLLAGIFMRSLEFLRD